MVLDDIINQDFKAEKRIDFKFKEHDFYFTVQKMPYHEREKVIDTYVKARVTKIDHGSGNEEFQAVDNYSELKQSQFKIIFENGLKKKEHNLTGGDLTLDWIEKLAVKCPVIFERIKYEILLFNGLADPK